MKNQSRISFHDQISRNKWKSFFLILVIFIVFVLLGYFIGIVMGPDLFLIVMIAAIVISIVYLLVGYYNSDKIALASVNAKRASRDEYPQYYNSVEGLTIASGMPMPKLYVMDNPEINAFASGRDPQHAVICVTKGALEKLDKQELEGVLGHELSHVANYDIRFMTLTAVLVGMIAIISEIFLRSLWFGGGRGRSDNDKANLILMVVGIILAILAPIVVYLVQLTISRKREYVADASAVKFIRSPTGLINALRKIQKEHPKENELKTRKISKAVAPLFISDPFKKKIQNVFSTHPRIEKRIRTLERM